MLQEYNEGVQLHFKAPKRLKKHKVEVPADVTQAQSIAAVADVIWDPPVLG
jgi:hypothetical protein